MELLRLEKATSCRESCSGTSRSWTPWKPPSTSRTGLSFAEQRRRSDSERTLWGWVLSQLACLRWPGYPLFATETALSKRATSHFVPESLALRPHALAMQRYPALLSVVLHLWMSTRATLVRMESFTQRTETAFPGSSKTACLGSQLLIPTLVSSCYQKSAQRARGWTTRALSCVSTASLAEFPSDQMKNNAMLVWQGGMQLVGSSADGVQPEISAVWMAVRHALRVSLELHQLWKGKPRVMRATEAPLRHRMA
mmetsp:Transcript_30168/g.70411  ORF Transcript_30168/g.70411 Transcript_30168/m.70411 type:complete len:254 (-) Transcript_30168:2879-3640(-)